MMALIGKLVWLASAALLMGLSCPSRAHADDQQDLLIAFKEASRLHGQKDYAAAARYYEQSLTLARRVFGPDGSGTGTVMEGLANLHCDAGEHAKAEPLYQRAIKIAEVTRGRDHAHVILHVQKLANVYQALEQYAKAKPLYLRVIKAREAALGAEHADLAWPIYQLAIIYDEAKQYHQAENLYLRCLKIEKASLGHDHLNLTYTLNKLGNLYQATEQHTQAEQQFREALKIAEAKLGPEHPEVIDDIVALAEFYRDTGQYPLAESLYGRTLKIREAHFGPEHLDVAESLSSLASVYVDMRQYDQAELLYLRSLRIREGKLGTDDVSIADGLIDLGIMYRDLGQYSKAEPLFIRNLRIRQAALPPDDRAVAGALDYLGIFYTATGKYAKAEEFYARSLDILESKLGSDHPELSGPLNNLANLYVYLGRYAQAEPLYQRSLMIKQADLGSEVPEVARLLNNMAALYMAMGQYTKAEPLYERSLRIREAQLPANHPQISESLLNLASFYRITRQYDRAEGLYERCLRIRETSRGPDHPDVADCLNNLANLYCNLEKLAEAQPLYERSLKIREAALGPDHPDVAASLNNLAQLRQRQGKHAEAKTLYQQGAKIYEAAFGPDHPDVSDSLYRLARLDVEMGDPRSAATRFEASRRIVRRHVSRVLPVLSEREQLTFLDNLDRTDLEVALSSALQWPDDSHLAELSAGWLANFKAVAQDTLAQRTQLARDTRDPKMAGLVSKLQAVRTELANLALTPLRPGQQAQRDSRLARLAGEERSLSKEIAAGRGQPVHDDPWVTTEAIRKALPKGAVLIDIARTDIWEFGRATKGDGDEATAGKWLDYHYVAWIVPRLGKVQIVNFGSAETIEAAIRDYQAVMARAQTGRPLRELGEAEAAAELVEPLAKLSRLVLDPLKPYLEDAQELVLSPDGALWLVPWAALPASEDQLAIERWQIRYVVAGRDVALEQLRRTAGFKFGPPRIFADPDYDLSPQDAIVAYKAIFNPGGKLPASAHKAIGPHGGMLTVRSATELGLVRSLPGTAAEAARVAPKLMAYTRAQPKSYVGRQAQEGVFKRLVSPQVLLVSTHGFFLPDQQSPTAASPAAEALDEQQAANDDQGNVLENPLLRCGLLLAGCNQRDRNTGKNLDDGILTGLEIVGVDMRGTELVVLSACETGLGKVNNGEGVAGLRQAFQLAGARTVVSTLWQIPDKDSALLMDDFFADLATGQSTAAALRNAQLKRIHAHRARYGAAHPFFWAAWTVTGQ